MFWTCRTSCSGLGPDWRISLACLRIKRVIVCTGNGQQRRYRQHLSLLSPMKATERILGARLVLVRDMADESQHEHGGRL